MGIHLYKHDLFSETMVFLKYIERNLSTVTFHLFYPVTINLYSVPFFSGEGEKGPPYNELHFKLCIFLMHNIFSNFSFNILPMRTV